MKLAIKNKVFPIGINDIPAKIVSNNPYYLITLNNKNHNNNKLNKIKKIE